MGKLMLGNQHITPVKTIGGTPINNQDKTITQNGSYTADTGYTGLGTVTVNVSGGGGSEWQPDPDWWDIETILSEDTEDYAGKAIILYGNGDNFTDFTIASPCVKIKTSDGSTYTSTSTHTWDRTKDKIVTTDTSDTTPKFGTRYVILYFNTADVVYTALTNFRNGSIYAVFGCNLTKTSSSSIASNSFFYSNRTLKSFKFLGSYNFNFGTNFQYFLQDCTNLTKIPDDINTTNATDFRNFAQNASALLELPKNLDMSSAINIGGMCRACYCMYSLPDIFDLSVVTTVGSIFVNCYSLFKTNIKLPNKSVTTLNSSSNLSIESLQYIADNAPTVTGTVTLTIGSTNITRAGGASGTIIQTLTNKGWTVN